MNHHAVNTHYQQNQTSLKRIETALNHTTIHNEVELNSVIYAGTLPIPTSNTIRDGWVHLKTEGVEKFNYYFFQHNIFNPILLPELNYFYALVSCDTIQSANDLAFLVLYTKPDGVGDYYPGFFKSSIAYTIDTTKHKLHSGEKILIYSGNTRPDIYNNYRKIKCESAVVLGDALPSETVNLLTVHSDSSAAVNNQIVTHGVGWGNNHIKMNLNLV